MEPGCVARCRVIHDYSPRNDIRGGVESPCPFVCVFVSVFCPDDIF